MRALILGAALLLTATPAAAYDAQQEDVLRKLAMAFAISKRCPRLVVDETIAAPAMLRQKLTMDDLDEVRIRGERLVSEFADHEVLDVCNTGIALFGENGSKVPHALKSLRPVLLAKRARFVAFSKATAEKCDGVIVQAEAMTTSDLPPQTAFIVKGLIDEEQPKARKAVAAMTCDQAVAATLKLTRRRPEQVFVRTKEN